MKKLKLLLFSFVIALAFTVYASPKNDILEITAHICHFSEAVNSCRCQV